MAPLQFQSESPLWSASFHLPGPAGPLGLPRNKTKALPQTNYSDYRCYSRLPSRFPSSPSVEHLGAMKAAVRMPLCAASGSPWRRQPASESWGKWMAAGGHPWINASNGIPGIPATWESRQSPVYRAMYKHGFP